MKRACVIGLVLAAGLLLAACVGSTKSDDDIPIYHPDGDVPHEDGDEPDGDVDGDEEPEDGDLLPEDGDIPKEDGDDGVFNPENPGVSMTFFIGAIEMMGQGTEMSVATVTPATREEFRDVGGDVPDGPILDECDFSSSEGTERPNECETDADCAPEQVCYTDQDSGYKSCRTPVEAMDVGPISVTGFNGGVRTFAYNPEQSGAYTENGQGDGSLESGSIAFDTTYTLSGDGDPSQGLGAFTGSVIAPAQISLTSPTPQETAMGMMAIPIDLNEDLLIRWEGSGNPDNTFTVSVSGLSGTLTCVLRDDGEHLIYRDLLGRVGLTTDPMWSIANMVLIQSDSYGTITGDGVTRSETTFQQIVMLNATVVQ